MQNLLIRYMEGRFKGDVVPLVPGKPDPLPVVTISRETGCSGTSIAVTLVARLNQLSAGQKPKVEWKVINKEVIERAARELELNTSTLEPIFKGESKSILDEMVQSMSTRYYKSDRQIRKTITDVIRFYANQGHVVIVGRAGVVITKDHPRAVHVKLHAPLDWRMEVISHRQGISIGDAMKYINETDKGRTKLLRDFKCEPMDCELFDAVLNCKTLGGEELVEVIIKLMEGKKLILGRKTVGF